MHAMLLSSQTNKYHFCLCSTSGRHLQSKITNSHLTKILCCRTPDAWRIRRSRHEVATSSASSLSWWLYYNLFKVPNHRKHGGTAGVFKCDTHTYIGNVEENHVCTRILAASVDKHDNVIKTWLIQVYTQINRERETCRVFPAEFRPWIFLNRGVVDIMARTRLDWMLMMIILMMNMMIWND